jgi:hypothetical protein
VGALLLAWPPSAATAQTLPAVSSANGRLELDAGVLSLPAPGFTSRAAGSLTLPLGEQFGLQAELGVNASRGFGAGAALHLFTRDPQSHLVGGVLSALVTPGATVLAAGPEAELYFDRWTLEAWGGLTYARPAAGPERIGGFVRAGVAAYPTDNLRLSLALSHFDGYNALHAGGEMLLDALPISLTADAQLGQDGAVRATIGLRGHIGGAPTKSLIRRHREDFVAPAAGGALLAALAGPALFSAPVASASTTPPPTLRRPSQPENEETTDPSSEEQQPEDKSPPDEDDRSPPGNGADPDEKELPPEDNGSPPGDEEPDGSDSGDEEQPPGGDDSSEGGDPPDEEAAGPECLDAFQVYNPETLSCEDQ